MLSFVSSLPGLQRPRVRTVTVCSTTPSTPALDSLPPSLKLNAVAATLAQQNDHEATKKLLLEMKKTGTKLESRTLAAVFDSFARDSDALSDIILQHPPDGYGTSSPPQCTPVDTIDSSKPVEITLAGGFLFTVTSCIAGEALEPVAHSGDEATTVLILLLCGLAFDRYAAQSTLWKTLLRGLRRLFREDPVRVARVDAASFLIAYLLGIPWLAYRGDARRVLMSCDATDEDQTRETLQKALVWLCAGAAAEGEVDGLLIDSSLSEARALLRQARKRGIPLGSRDETAIRSAVSAASSLLSSQRDVYSALSEAMLQSASVGECVALAAEKLD